ncbi:MAG TPA: lactate utilization protein [Candidatus Avidesulfovibrio excrementigallinarum]|nr:lactate utilization protein [Candidatus Avidesulfovibrio excrementigallinarum]
MDPANQELIELFIARAEEAAAKVRRLPDMAAALQYAVEVCMRKAPCELLADEDVEKGPDGPNRVPTRMQKILAAPDLDDKDFAALSAACAAQGIACCREGLRNHLAGIDVGLTTARLGVAASGTCLTAGDNEDARLAGMISEVHILILPVSRIYPDLPSIAGLMRDRMNERPGSYTVFITGPSRTADIERVNAIGVHGPLELHIVLLEDTHV